jgi:hypothetical protein
MSGASWVRLFLSMNVVHANVSKHWYSTQVSNLHVALCTILMIILTLNSSKKLAMTSFDICHRPTALKSMISTFRAQWNISVTLTLGALAPPIPVSIYYLSWSM